MLLDIIIPQYSESDNVIKELLDSINNQVNIYKKDISITIVNDASSTLISDKLINSYSELSIKYIRRETNGGPGLARQFGFDNTNSYYVMFIDADDVLYDNISLNAIIDFLIKNQPDYLVTNIACESIIKNKPGWIIKKGKDTFPWMHGKVYKRSFLNQNEIRFSEHVRDLEDSYFTTCVLGILGPDKVKYLDYPTVRWKANLSSLTRAKKNHHYTVETFDDFFYAPQYAYEYLSKHKSNYRFSYLASSLMAIYIILNSDIFALSDLDEKRAKYNRLLAEYIKTKRNIFIIIGYERLEGLYQNELKELTLRNGLKRVYKSFDDFYNTYIR